MTAPSLPPITITAADADRLYGLADAWARRNAAAATDLSDELDRATIVSPEEIAPDVVTMRSRVLFRLDDTGDMEATLVYPGEENIASGKISVATAVGSALIGLSEGQSIAWRTLTGRTKTLTVIKVLFQPEAAGQYDL